MYSRIVVTKNYFPVWWCNNVNNYMMQNVQPDSLFGKKGVRKCTVRLLHSHMKPYEQIFKSMIDYVKMKQNLLNVDLDYKIDGAIQHITYLPGDHVGWHDDTMDLHTAAANPKYRDLTTSRKLSMTVMLSDPSSYSGGQFVFDPKYSPSPAVEGQGTVALFTCFSKHKVEEITSGVRNIMFIFLTGPEWK